MKAFTKAELHNEIRTYMCAFADCLERVYFMGAGWGLLGLDSKDYPKTEIYDLKPEDIDVNKFYITDMLDELYEYGVSGRRNVHFDWLPDDDDAVFFLQGLDEFPLMYENTMESIPTAFSDHTVKMARARWILDEGSGMDMNEAGDWIRLGVLTLNDVALLANMDEKSVRNAANPKHKNHLKTFNHGARTYVDVEDARAWLQQRRGFKPTVIVDKSAERDLTRIGFFSEQDFGSYLVAIPDSLTEEKLGSLEHGQFVFAQVLFVALSQLYELDTKAFVLAALALHQRLERERIEEQINTQIQD
jgi:hypothetical protein